MQKTKIIYYCKCGQAVRFRKKDKKWVHIYSPSYEPYSEFKERTNHPIDIVGKKEWIV